MPFALALTILTLPLSVRDPVVMAPILGAAATFGGYSLHHEPPRGWLHAVLWAQVGLLGLLAVGMMVLLVMVLID